jgi:pimeloyl-ACP methyl ester carboxylesterase
MTQRMHELGSDETPVRITLERLTLDGVLAMPPEACGLVLFAHGSGSSRFSPRNRFVAQQLNQAGIATLLFDLLTAEEEAGEAITRHLRFNIDLLSERLVAATDYVSAVPDTAGLPFGYFGASTGAAAALTAAAERPALIRAVVSRGGRPDLAAPRIAGVRAPTLLIVGGADREVLALNQSVLPLLPAHSELAVVPHATHLFEEPGTLEQVARLATAWFDRWLQ